MPEGTPLTRPLPRPRSRRETGDASPAEASADLSAGEQDAIVALLTAGAFPPAAFERACERLGSAEAVLAATPGDLCDALQITTAHAREAQRALDTEDVRLAVIRERKLRADHGVRILTPRQPEYPALLRLTPNRPPALWVRGALQPRDAFALAVLGSSRPTPYGEALARRFAGAAADHGLTVVTGGERGIDTAACRAALDLGERAIVALGAGLLAHGRQQDALYDRVAESGAVISGVPMLVPPDTFNQTAGDALVSGLALAILVAEAAAHGGALIAARIAHDEHHRRVLAPPGPIGSDACEGSNRLIQSGRAVVVLGEDDLLAQVAEAVLQVEIHALTAHTPSWGRGQGPPRSPCRPELDERERRILREARPDRPLSELAAATGLTPDELRRSMFRLQLAQRLPWTIGPAPSQPSTPVVQHGR